MSIITLLLSLQKLFQLNIENDSKMRFIYLLILLSLSHGANCISIQNQINIDACPCLNDGICKTNESGAKYCSCPEGFIGKNCDKQAINLANLEEAANITEQYSYYFITFNTSTLYYVEIFFCPLDYNPQVIFQLRIQFQEEDGSIGNTNSSQSHSLIPRQKYCSQAKYVILPFKKKYNGQLIRLVVQVKSSTFGSASKKELPAASQLKITHMVYQFYKLTGQAIGQFMVISTLSSALLICLTFAICRRIFMRRVQRFVYHPAVAVRDISSFDVFMPPVLYPVAPEINLEEKQCMICLLNVENTLTRTTPCLHMFHKDCIDEWGRKSLTCPTCRAPLEGQPSNASIDLV